MGINMSKIKQFFKQQDIKTKTKLFEQALLSDDIVIPKNTISKEDKQKLMDSLFVGVSVPDNFDKTEESPVNKEENLIEDLFNSILEVPDIIKEKEETKDINNVIKEVNKKTDNHKEKLNKDELFDIVIKESLKLKKDGLTPDPELEDDINSLDLSDTDKLMSFLKKLIEQINILKKQPRQYASGGGGGVSTSIIDLK